MKLTPLDIRHKEFKRAMRGYADVEVDEFLDEVGDEFERLFKENIDLNERVEALEGQVSGYKRIEETLQKTLVSAQASADELKQNSTKEAQLILHEAELKSRQLVNEAYTERQSIEQSMAKLRSAEQDFRFKFRQLLEGYIKHIEEAPATVAMAPAEGMAQAEFARNAEAIKQAIAREGAADAESVAPAAADAATAVDAVPGPGAAVAESEQPVAAARGSEEPVAAAPDDEAPVPAAPESEKPVAAQSEEAPDEVTAAPITDEVPQPPATPGPGAEEGPARRERILFGESDDLLADVDTGVNENEFKW